MMEEREFLASESRRSFIAESTFTQRTVIVNLGGENDIHRLGICTDIALSFEKPWSALHVLYSDNGNNLLRIALFAAKDSSKPNASRSYTFYILSLFC